MPLFIIVMANVVIMSRLIIESYIQHVHTSTQHTRDDIEPTLTQHWVNVSCL